MMKIIFHQENDQEKDESNKLQNENDVAMNTSRINCPCQQHHPECLFVRKSVFEIVQT